MSYNCLFAFLRVYRTGQAFSLVKSPCTLFYFFFLDALLLLLIIVDIDTPLHWVGLAGVFHIIHFVDT